MDRFFGIYGNCEKRKFTTSPFQELKIVPKAFITWFNLAYIFIPHQLSHLFLVMWTQCFFQENKSEENVCLDTSYLEPKPSFFIFFECCKTLL